MSNLIAHAEDELKRAGLFDEDSDYNGMLGKAALDIVKVFSKQGHSGMSASITTQLVTKLMQYEPLTPLTGADDEWMAISTETMGRPGVYQNMRCSRVFKEGNRAYDIEGKVFRRKGESGSFMNGASHVDVTFPYTPTTEYVELEAEDQRAGDARG